MVEPFQAARRSGGVPHPAICSAGNERSRGAHVCHEYDEKSGFCCFGA